MKHVCKTPVKQQNKLAMLLKILCEFQTFYIKTTDRRRSAASRSRSRRGTPWWKASTSRIITVPDQTNQHSVGANETHPFPSSDGHGRLTALPWWCSDGNLCLHNSDVKTEKKTAEIINIYLTKLKGWQVYSSYCISKPSVVPLGKTFTCSSRTSLS